MFSQFFGQYLLDNQKITAEQFSSCMKYIKDNRVKLGLIAENEGLLTRNQANELNYLQMQTDKRFGDLAVEKGYLTEADVNYLLGRQGNPYLIFIQGLEENGIMSREEIETALDAFQKENGFSDEILKAIQDGNIEGMIPAFVDAKDSRYQSLIGLTLRNIVRFVSSYIRIEKGQFVTSHSAKYIAYQHTTGDYDGFLGFTCDDDSILALADGYAKETFDTVDEDALDSVCEFTNCVNGLYATELSYQDTTIDMQPPEFKFDSSIDGEGEFYVLLRNILVENGHEVIGEAENGQIGFEKYIELKPDIVTLDITMPVLDGLGALEKIIAYDENAHAVMVTAAGQKNKMVDAIKLGANEFVQKPFEPDQILSVIGNITK